WPEPSDPKGKRGGHQGLPAPVLKALQTPEPKRTEEQKEVLLAHFKWAAPELQALQTELARREAELSILNAPIATVVVTEATEPRASRILARGNFLDDSGAVVEPAVPAFLGKLATGGERATRLDLANWIVSPSNPLTARAFVNRLWRQFFGAG